MLVYQAALHGPARIGRFIYGLLALLAAAGHYARLYRLQSAREAKEHAAVARPA